MQASRKKRGREEGQKGRREEGRDRGGQNLWLTKQKAKMDRGQSQLHSIHEQCVIMLETGSKGQAQNAFTPNMGPQYA